MGSMTKEWLEALEDAKRLRAEVERLRATLLIVIDVAAPGSKAQEVARIGLEQSTAAKEPDFLEPGGISDRLANFDEWGNRIRDRG